MYALHKVWGQRGKEQYICYQNHILLSKPLAFKQFISQARGFLVTDNPQMVTSLQSLVFHRVGKSAVFRSCVVLLIQEKG